MLSSTRQLISKIRMAFYTPNEIEGITKGLIEHYQQLCSKNTDGDGHYGDIELRGSALEGIAHQLRNPNETDKSIWTSKQRELASLEDKPAETIKQRILSIESIRTGFNPGEESAGLIKIAEKSDTNFLGFIGSKQVATHIEKFGDAISLIQPHTVKTKPAATKKSKRAVYWVDKTMNVQASDSFQSIHPNRKNLVLSARNGNLRIQPKSLEMLLSHIKENIEQIESRIESEQKNSIDIDSNLFLGSLIGTVLAIKHGTMNKNGISRIQSELSKPEPNSDVRVHFVGQEDGLYVNCKECLESIISEQFFNYFEKIFGSTQIQICLEVQDSQSVTKACALSKSCDTSLQITFASEDRAVVGALGKSLIGLHASTGHEARAATVSIFDATEAQARKVRINAVYDAWLFKALKDNLADHEVCRIVEEKVLSIDINNYTSSNERILALQEGYANIVDFVARLPNIAEAYSYIFDNEEGPRPIQFTKNASSNEQLDLINATTFIGKSRIFETPEINSEDSLVDSEQTHTDTTNIHCPYSAADEFMNSLNAELVFIDANQHSGNHWTVTGIKNQPKLFASSTRRMERLPSFKEVVNIALSDVATHFDNLKFCEILLSEITSIRKTTLIITENARLQRFKDIEKYIPNIQIGDQTAKSFLLQACMSLSLVKTALPHCEQKEKQGVADQTAHNQIERCLSPSANEKTMPEKFLSLLADVLVESKNYGDLGRETIAAIVILACSICGVALKKSDLVMHIESLFDETAYSICKGGIRLDQRGLNKGSYDFKAKFSESNLDLLAESLKKYVSIQAKSKEKGKRALWLI